MPRSSWPDIRWRVNLLNSHRRFGSISAIERLIAVTLAVAVSWCFAALLFLSPLRTQSISNQKSLISVFLMPDIYQAVPPTQDKRVQGEHRNQDSLPLPRDNRDLLTFPGEVHQPLQNVTPSEIVSAMPAEAVSSPLRIDSSVIKNAARESKSNFRRLAEASGAYTGDQKPSAAEKLSNSIDGAIKPDCFGKNEHGSLLMIPCLLYTSDAADE